MICFPLDENAGKMVVVCPTRAYNDFRSLFIDDTKHYAPLSDYVTPEMILSKWSNHHNEKQWTRVVKFNPKGSIPYAHILLTRIRILHVSGFWFHISDIPLRDFFAYARGRSCSVC